MGHGKKILITPKLKKNVLLKMMGIINFDLIADHKKKNGIETFVSGT